jgi:hypothetical protein
MRKRAYRKKRIRVRTLSREKKMQEERIVLLKVGIPYREVLLQPFP